MREHLRELIGAAREGLPASTFGRWASVLFTLSILILLFSLAASQAFLFAAGVFYAAHLLRDRPPLSFPQIKLPLALFLLTTLVAIGGAENSAVGWLAVRKLVLFLILLLAVNLIVSAEHLMLIYQALFLESALAGVLGVVQFVRQYHRVRTLHPERIYSYMMSERISGFMGHWMHFGGQQMLVSIALVAFLVLRRGVRGSGPGIRDLGFGIRNSESQIREKAATPESRLVWWLTLVIITVSIVLNFTRGVWLGCFVAAVYLVGRWKPRWLWALPVVAAAGFLASPKLVRERIEILRHPSHEPAISIRFEMWQVGWQMIRRHPLIGVGPNNIPEVYTLYLPPGKAAEVGYREHLHNDYLQLAAERGLPCLAVWVWLMAALAWQLWGIRRQLAACSGQLWVVDAGIASLLAFLAEGFFEYNFGSSPVLMLFLSLVSTPFVAERQSSSSPNLKVGR